MLYIFFLFKEILKKMKLKMVSLIQDCMPDLAEQFQNYNFWVLLNHLNEKLIMSKGSHSKDNNKSISKKISKSQLNKENVQCTS